MSNIGPTVPLPPASAVPTYSPLGKPVVGNENALDKDRALPPVVQGEAAEKSRNRVESKPEGEQGERHSDDPTEQPDDEQAAVIQPQAPAIRVLPTGHAEPVSGRAALDAFNQTAGIDPGLLLDQRV